jgi:hypothetical protein
MCQLPLRIFLSILGYGLKAALCLAPMLANAHVVEVGHASVNLSGAQAFVVMSLPTTAFTGADDNGDGLLDRAEIQAHRLELIGQVQNGLRLLGDGQAAVWSDLVFTPSGSGTGPAQLVVVGAAAWVSTPRTMTLAYGLWSRSPATDPLTNLPARQTLKVNVTRSRDGQPVAQEVGLLSPDQSRLEFFAPVQRHIANFAQHGFEHILGGADHIVFLLALLARGIRVRRWAALLTAFTIAHGVTFGLASLGWVSVPATLVEPAIAASIVVVAALELLKIRVALGWETLLVFSLGLVHGLGFASAMQEEGASQLIALNPYPVWSILGFNLGVEAGQFSVAALLYASVRLFRSFFPQQSDALWQRAAGIFAMLIGSFWLLERIVRAVFG